MKVMTRVLRELAALVLLLAATNVFGQSATDTVTPDVIERGRYIATAGDCVACHTAPGVKPFAGGLPLSTPLGDIISTNITPSKTTGIGNYTLAQFTDAMRKGVRPDGAHLYPAMPYTAYAQVTDADMLALYTYFMRAVAPVDTAPPPTNLPFPFNIRLSMAAWNLLFLDGRPFQPEPSKNAEWNRGAYLARGLAHCGACHTPRNSLMAEEPSREFGGSQIGVWFAPNITSDVNSGIGGWSEDELVAYMRLGHTTGKAQTAGPMAEAIDNSLRHLTKEDLHAMAVYLKAVPALHDRSDTRPRYAWGSAADDLASIRGVALPKDLDQMTGPQLYDAHCSTCHQAQGQGSFDGGLPPLFHNTALGGANADNLVLVMLEGITRHGDVPEVPMPHFAKLSDRQLATLGAYLVGIYGNSSASVTEEQVRTLRAGGARSHLVLLARVAIAAGVVALLIALLVFRRRRQRISG